MITEFFLNLALGVVEWVVGLLPDWTPPAGITDADGMLSQVLAFGAGLGTWVDWATVGALALIPLGLWVIGVGWKLVRTLLSHIPGFGGSG